MLTTEEINKLKTINELIEIIKNLDLIKNHSTNSLRQDTLKVFREELEKEFNKNDKQNEKWNANSLTKIKISIF